MVVNDGFLQTVRFSLQCLEICFWASCRSWINYCICVKFSLQWIGFVLSWRLEFQVLFFVLVLKVTGSQRVIRCITR